MRYPRLFYAQTAALLGGTAFAWYTVYTDFARFYGLEGTIFKIEDCIFPNPVTTPCFWGAWAFLIALIWSFRILRAKSAVLRSQKHLVWFLIAGTLFAFSNFGYGLVKFFANAGKPTIGCSGQLVTNPLATPCFIGALFFLVALIVALCVLRSQMKRFATPESKGGPQPESPAGFDR